MFSRRTRLAVGGGGGGLRGDCLTGLWLTWPLQFTDVGNAGACMRTSGFSNPAPGFVKGNFKLALTQLPGSPLRARSSVSSPAGPGCAKPLAAELGPRDMTAACVGSLSQGGWSLRSAAQSPDPSAGAGEARVRVKGGGINFADLMARMGLYPDAPKIPCVVGYEVSGVIDQVGAGVTAYKVGDRVIGVPKFGGYTDTLVVPRPNVLPMPERMSFEEGPASRSSI